MSRITTINYDTANAEQQGLFDAIQGQLGVVPNFLKILAHSPVALRAFLGLHGVANDGSLDPQTRERIALAVAQQNTCEYCLSAHTAIGRKAGLDNQEIAANRSGSSQDAKAAVAVKFAQALVEHTGDVATADILAMREVGYSDSDIVEVITHVGMNILTNMIGKASRVDIDFPKVSVNIS
ncbi:MAG: carboxymuconolactone decarboxylase family protein, partial [Flavobacteriales bacterium]